MKVWFITGSSSGFGNELVKEAVKRGDAVIATARNPKKLEEFAGNEQVRILTLDVTDPASITAAVTEGLAWKGRVDILVNNAGIGHVGAVEETTREELDTLFGVNVYGLIDTTKALLPHFRERKAGRIVNISSVAGLFTMPGFGPYCATKHAVEAISDGLRAELAPYDVRVTIVEPGAFRTGFVGNVLSSAENGAYDATAKPTRDMLTQLGTSAKGDPAKAAAHMYTAVTMDEPPLRLPLGEDAWEWVQHRMKELPEQLFAHEKLSRGTDF